MHIRCFRDTMQKRTRVPRGGRWSANVKIVFTADFLSPDSDRTDMACVLERPPYLSTFLLLANELQTLSYLDAAESIATPRGHTDSAGEQATACANHKSRQWTQNETKTFTPPIKKRISKHMVEDSNLLCKLCLRDSNLLAQPHIMGTQPWGSCRRTQSTPAL